MATYNPRSDSRRAQRLSVVQSEPATAPDSKLAQTPAVQPSALRLLLVWGVLVASGLGLAAKLVQLQVVQAPILLQKAREQQLVSLRPFVPRRPIVDRTGNVLAVDQPVYTLYVHPKLFKEPKEAIAAKLAPLLDRSVESLLQQFNKAETGIQVEYALSEGVADRIATLQADGIELIRQQQRLYPQQNLAADVVGYVNLDRQGQAGVEYSQQKLLERTVQSARLMRTGTGDLLPSQLPGGFLHVDDLRLQLTLDSRLQRAARAALQQQIKRYAAKRGAVIVMDAKDGSLLALVADPSYDPNQYSKFSLELFKNWTITDLYEPGSTFKPLNVAIALEAGVIQADDVFYDEGRIQVGGWPIENYDYSYAGAKGPLSITQILQNSSNVGMVHIVQQMKRETYYDWLQRLGLGKKTGIDLPFEIPGQLKSRDLFIQTPIEATTASFGQGLSLTPIQLVQMHAALANGGKLVTPHVVRGLLDANNQLQWQPNRPAPKRLFSPKNTQAVVNMMENVVSRGTGKTAKIKGYRIGGKTGTAQKANPNGGYYGSAKITSFVGIFPIEAPRYVVLAVIDEPTGGNAFGSTVTAPIVKAVMEALISIEGIPPSQGANPK